jgi:hypothetical protein
MLERKAAYVGKVEEMEKGVEVKNGSMLLVTWS